LRKIGNAEQPVLDRFGIVLRALLGGPGRHLALQTQGYPEAGVANGVLQPVPSPSR
jgi:hypothetical protein